MRAALITTQICGVVSETHERLRKNYRQPIYVTPRPCAPQGQMTTFLQPDEATNVDFAEPRQKRDRDRVACFLHLRDLVYLHPKAASADAIAFVQKLEAAVIAEKAAREKRLAEVRKREAERRQEADRQKAAVEQGGDLGDPFHSAKKL